LESQQRPLEVCIWLDANLYSVLFHLIFKSGDLRTTHSLEMAVSLLLKERVSNRITRGQGQ
jgi:hypothetical protein